MNIAMIGQKGIQTGAKAGGIERHVEELASRLVHMGHRVRVYARRRYHPKVERKIKGINMVYVPTIYLKYTEAFVHTLLSTIHALLHRVDVYHYHGVGPATLAWIPRLLAPRATVVVTFHSQDQFHQKWGYIGRKYLAFGERAAVLFPHYCIAVSHAIQVYCRDTFNREVIFIPNGAVVKHVRKADELAQFGLKKKEYILNVGRLVHQKGLQYLIEAFKQIKTEKQLVIVGASGFDTDYEKDLRALADGDERIHFLGFQSGDTLDQIYANAYLYVHPSESEGLPLVILEAMSFGLMPLVSDIAPNVEAIHHTGATFASTNVKDLKQKLERFLDHPELVEEEQDDVIAVVETYFNWDVIARRTESVYLTARH